MMRTKMFIPNKAMLDQYSDVEYLCYVIAFHAAPTILRRKASSLITFKNGSRPLKQIWLENRKQYQEYFPMEYFCLCERKDSITILFYHSDLLESCLKGEETKDFLANYGYTENMDLSEKLAYLAMRYRQICPHEIGVFLDYPLHDVKAFTACERKTCILTGYWKVYAEEKNAIRRFREFDHSKYQILCALFDGVSPKRVAYA